MLRACAPGHSAKLTDHFWLVFFKKKSFALPKGEHGRQDPEIQMLQVRKMVRQLEIERECVKEHLPDLEL